jgi:hypothetical protein
MRVDRARLRRPSDVEAGRNAAALPWRFLLGNARCVPLDWDEVVTPGMAAALVEDEPRQRGRALQRIVVGARSTEAKDVDEMSSLRDDDEASLVVTEAASAVGIFTSLGERYRLPEESLRGASAAFESLPRSGSLSDIEVIAVLDPVSTEAQRAAPLLLLLRDALGARIRVYLSPLRAVDPDHPPLRSFYRLVAPALSPGQAQLARFTSVPAGRVLSLDLLPPEPMNVQQAQGSVDVDNLLLPAGGRSATAYALRTLLVAGQCDDVTLHRAPNGLQLRLDDALDAAVSDTLVMQNLGYFQLQAGPGVWDLQLAEGRGKELYEIEGGTDFLSSEADGGGEGVVEDVEDGVDVVSLPVAAPSTSHAEALEHVLALSPSLPAPSSPRHPVCLRRSRALLRPVVERVDEASRAVNHVWRARLGSYDARLVAR